VDDNDLNSEASQILATYHDGDATPINQVAVLKGAGRSPIRRASGSSKMATAAGDPSDANPAWLSVRLPLVA
jgi:hypothetical protein